MKPISLFFVLFLVLGLPYAYAQVAINTDGSNPDPAAMLDVQSPDKGILIPRINFNNLPAEPPPGLLVYATSNGPDGDNAFYYYNGTEWLKLYHHFEADYVPYENATRTLNLGEQSIISAFGSMMMSVNNQDTSSMVFEQAEISGGILNGKVINQIRSANNYDEINLLGVEKGLILRGHLGDTPEDYEDAVLAFHINGNEDLLAMVYSVDTLVFMVVGDDGAGNTLLKPIPQFLVAAANTSFHGSIQITEPDTARLVVKMEDFGEGEGYMPVISGYKFVEDENRNIVEKPSPIVLSQGVLLWDEHQTGIQGIIFANHNLEEKGMIIHGYNDTLNTQGFLILGDIYTFGRQTYAYKGNSEPEINEVLSLYYYGNKTPGSGSMMRFKSRRTGFDFLGSSINTAAFAGLMTDSSEENWSGSLHGYVYNAQYPVDGILFMEVDGSGKISFKNFGHKIGQDSHHVIFKEYIAENGDYAGSRIPVLQGMGDMWYQNNGTPISLGTKSVGIGVEGFVMSMPDTASFQGQANPAYYFWDPDIGEPGAAIEWDYFEQDAGSKKMIFRSEDGFRFEGNVEIYGILTNTHTYQLGERAHGGIIFYLDESGKHGLVVEEYDLYTELVGLKWSGETTFSATRAETNGIYAGFRNTERIILLQDPGYGFYAARLCSMHFGNGYGDWYLPSTHELNMIYYTLHLQNIGNFTAGKYWTSREGDQSNAEYLDFETGTIGSASKNNEFRVRPVRRF